MENSGGGRGKVGGWGRETFGYFDSDYQGYGVKNALTLKSMLNGGERRE